ncbi:MAG: T9SS type A sorting domain-containing protein [Bacteroidetes bacterium]|nr:T9SS type A sorting domain-containing protein [Bacteroidota bacterium]
MTKNRIFSLLSVICLLCVSFFARGTTITVTGPNQLCVGSTGTYFITPTTGVNYVWTSTLGTITGSSTLPTVNVSWSATPGTGTVSVNGYNSSGSLVETGSLSVTLTAIPTPLIFTNYRVGCTKIYTVDTSGGGPEPPPLGDTLLLDDKNGCVKVCENSLVTYTVTGSGGSYSWAVVGGTIQGSSSGSSIVVRWGTVGSGSVTVTETVNGCAGSKTSCIAIIEKPTAAFSVLPSTTSINDGDTISLCLHANLALKDLSTGSSSSGIVSWNWFWGDGTASGQKNPPIHSYSATGYYKLQLVVKNECGCVDTLTGYVHVLSDPGPAIYCPTVACENDSVKYSTDTTGCTSYNWQVVGGTIQGSNTNSSVVVLWDNVDASGFGYVTLDVSCTGLCPEPTTIKVPVVQSNPTVTGPSKLCVHNQYQYSIPLWPGTEYNWGVINYPWTVVSDRKSNQITLKFDTAGTYTVHVTWQNHLSVCGGDKTFTVTVYDEDTIVGPNNSCKSSTGYIAYTLKSGNSANWELTDPTGSVTTGSGTVFSAGFTMAGIYTLNAVDYCAAPMVITVSEVTATVDSVSGEDTVCLGQPYVYNAYSAIPGYTYSWTATGGSVVTSTSGSSATVVWTSLPGTLKVRRQLTSYPYCEGADYTINIIQDAVAPNITGPDTVCSDSYNDYTCNYRSSNATYTWEVVSETKGNITAGTYDPDVTFKANHFTTTQTAKIIVHVKNCNTTVSDTFDVVIVPRPLPAITGDTLFCSGDTITFTATDGAGSYAWDFGDQGSRTTSINTVDKVFWNATGSQLTYYVTVDATGGTVLCPPNGKATLRVHVDSGPVVSAFPLDTTIFCDTATVSSRLRARVIGTGTFTYQWYKYPTTLLSGATDSTYTATGDGEYYCIVTKAGGCKSKTNSISVRVISCSTCAYAPNPPVPAPTSPFCGSFPVSASWSSYPNVTSSYTSWFVSPASTSSMANATATSVDVAVTQAGTYTIIYKRKYINTLTHDTCYGENASKIDVPLVTSWGVDFNCVTGGYNAVLKDGTSFLTGYNGSTGITIAWTVTGPGGTFTGTGATFTVPTTSAGTYTVTHTVTLNSTPTVTCTSSSTTYILPANPTIGITYSPNSICEGLPISFSPNITPSGWNTNVTSYLWDFDDAAFSALDNTQRVYTWSPTFNPMNKAPFLTVTDRWGCTHTSSSGSIDIYRNLLGGTVLSAYEGCGPSTTLSYTSTGASTPTRFMWSTETTFGTTNTNLTVFNSGSYFKTVEDAHLCRKVSDPVDVIIHSIETTGIIGSKSYCDGETVALSCFAGPPSGSISYVWKRNGTTLPNYVPFLFDPVPVGTYVYTVDITLTYAGGSCTVSDTDTVVVHAIPAKPTISLNVLDCNLYKLELVGSGPGGGSLLWSNGATGSSNVIYSGGPYRLWYYDSYGCVSYNDTLIPQSPESFFGWWPDGCYKFCQSQYPLKIFGPPGVWAKWDWHYGAGSIIDNGTATAIRPLSITSGTYGAGDYYMLLGNGLCSLSTKAMSITDTNCSYCPPVIIGQVTLTCDPTIPGGYIMNMTLNNPDPTNFVNFIVGLDVGPAIPFMVSLPPGSSMLNFNVTAMSMPTYVEVSYTLPGGIKCFQRAAIDPIFTYPCTGWPQQKTTGVGNTANNEIPTGMVVYPNPASHTMQVGYNYGIKADAQRSIAVYDMMGRKLSNTLVSSYNGTAVLDVAGWAQGVYIVRMEENGKAVHTQRVTVTR